VAQACSNETYRDWANHVKHCFTSLFAAAKAEKVLGITAQTRKKCHGGRRCLVRKSSGPSTKPSRSKYQPVISRAGRLDRGDLSHSHCRISEKRPGAAHVLIGDRRLRISDRLSQTNRLLAEQLPIKLKVHNKLWLGIRESR